MILLFPVGLLVDGITRVNDYTMTTPPSTSPKYPWLVYCQMIGQLLNLWASDGAIHSTKKGSSLSLSLWKKMYRSSCGETCLNHFDVVVFFFLWGVFCMSKVLYFFIFQHQLCYYQPFCIVFLVQLCCSMFNCQYLICSLPINTIMTLPLYAALETVSPLSLPSHYSDIIHITFIHLKSTVLFSWFIDLLVVAIAAVAVAAAAAAAVVVVVVGWVLELQGRKTVPVVSVLSLRPKAAAVVVVAAAVAVASAYCCSLFLCLRTYLHSHSTCVRCVLWRGRRNICAASMCLGAAAAMPLLVRCWTLPCTCPAWYWPRILSHT